MTPLRIGIVDSGATADHADLIDAAAQFCFNGETLQCNALGKQHLYDLVGHGSAVLNIVANHAPKARFCIAQVFTERPRTTALQVAAAIEWLIDQHVAIINLSLGLREDRPVLREACCKAVAAGIVICAASPARGDPVFPAAYNGILKMTGDARCTRDEYSCLNSRYADFGAHVMPWSDSIVHVSEDRKPPVGSGASMGCAHMTGHCAALCTKLLTKSAGLPMHRELLSALSSTLRDTLCQNADYYGVEQRK